MGGIVMVKFLHTADWHLGIRYTQLGEKADKARQIRIQTIQKLVDTAKNENLDFVLIAGDLFDSNDLDRRIVTTVVEILASAPNLPFYIIPGNHDPLTKDSFYNEKAWDVAENVTIFKENKPFKVPYCDVTIYPCPVSQKQSRTDPTEWIMGDEDEISIGLAHGNLHIQGFIDEANFPINPERAVISNLDYLALGEWHSLYEHSTNGIIKTIYSGTPETTKFGEDKSGNAVIVELTEPGTPPVIKPIQLGTVSWNSIESTINNIQNINDLENELKQYENPINTFLNIKLKGVITQEIFDYLDNFERTLEDIFLFFSLNIGELYLKPSMMEFKAVLPEGALLINTFKALMALMKMDGKTQEFSDIPLDEAEDIFKDIKHLESVQKTSPEVLTKASVLLYQMIKEASR